MRGSGPRLLGLGCLSLFRRWGRLLGANNFRCCLCHFFRFYSLCYTLQNTHTNDERNRSAQQFCYLLGAQFNTGGATYEPKRSSYCISLFCVCLSEFLRYFSC